MLQRKFGIKKRDFRILTEFLTGISILGNFYFFYFGNFVLEIPVFDIFKKYMLF